MDNAFILNPSISLLGIKEAINERLTKARSVVSCLAGNYGIAELHQGLIYGAIWSLDSLLEEIEYLQDQLEKSHTNDT